MFPRNSLLLLAVSAAALLAQGPDVPLDPKSSFKVNLPGEGPLSLVSADWGQSRATARGGALVVDLHSTLTLKNTSARRVRGVSLLVLAQEVTPGGKASVTVPSLDVPPGETFPIRVDLRLMRPLAQGAGALVEVGLDGVLFEDLVFYGPNRLQAKRAMVAWEMEARRDRKAMLAALESGGRDALQKKLLAVLSRVTDQAGGVQMARTMPATNVEAGRQLEFAFLQMPESPVELLSGSAQMDGAEARSPRIEVQNRSKRAVRYVELGWLARDGQGREFAGGTLPAELSLPSGQRTTIRKENTLRFSRAVAGLTAYPAAVEFADGEMWVPPAMAALPASGEAQRLAEMYRRKGLDAVVLQLRSMR
ncbi:MAG TPA: hypothetical protein VGK29_14980 [Paludibaculum sp.]|jgi:hypothetical protein